VEKVDRADELASFDDAVSTRIVASDAEPAREVES
jgi:hypothetical protein